MGGPVQRRNSVRGTEVEVEMGLAFGQLPVQSNRLPDRRSCAVIRDVFVSLADQAGNGN